MCDEESFSSRCWREKEEEEGKTFFHQASHLRPLEVGVVESTSFPPLGGARREGGGEEKAVVIAHTNNLFHLRAYTRVVCVGWGGVEPPTTYNCCCCWCFQRGDVKCWDFFKNLFFSLHDLLKCWDEQPIYICQFAPLTWEMKIGLFCRCAVCTYVQ